VAPGDTTTYIVSVSDGNLTHHDTTRVTVEPLPTVFAGNDTTLCSYVGAIQLYGIATNYKGIRWGSSGNGVFSDHNSLNTTYYFGSKDYQADSVDLLLVVFAKSPCPGRITGTRHIVLDPCTGTPVNTKVDLNIIIRPNPAGESATLTIPGLDNISAILKINDLNGKVLFSEVIPASPGLFTKSLNLKGYPSGIYIVSVTANKRVITKELIVK
jgi:hypothetical protein